MSDSYPAILIDADRISRRVQELAEEISGDYASTDNLIMVGILKGAFVFLADLSRQLTVQREIDFMALSSYGKSHVSSGAVRLVMDMRENIEGCDVLVVEDIVDTGRTLRYLLNLLKARSPASLKTCALVQKTGRATVDVPIDYLGFKIPDVWVVGYGLDYAEQYRTLPYIGVISPENGQ